jgi:hypothetical protein
MGRAEAERWDPSGGPGQDAEAETYCPSGLPGQDAVEAVAESRGNRLRLAAKGNGAAKWEGVT